MANPKLQRAEARASKLYPLSAGFRKAYVKGARAAFDGRSADTCPYKSRRGWLAWRRAWLRGYQSVTPLEF